MPRQPQHFAGGAPHAAETHLAQEVVVVLVEQHELRLEHVELALEALEILGQHGVEQRHLVPGLAQHGGDLQRRQRWIGFGAFLLFLVETQEIRMADQDGKHAESTRWDVHAWRDVRCRHVPTRPTSRLLKGEFHSPADWFLHTAIAGDDISRCASDETDARPGKLAPPPRLARFSPLRSVPAPCRAGT